MIYFMAPCPYCDELLEDEDDFFYHVTTCDYIEKEDEEW